MLKILLVLLIGAAFAFGFLYWQNGNTPVLGLHNNKLKPLGNKPNGVSSQTDMASKRVDPLPMQGNTQDTMSAIKKTLDHYALGKTTIQQETDNYLYVEFVTPTMKWIDDAEFFIDEQSQLVHFRSQSRAGHSDLGLNQTRYDELVAIYNELPKNSH